MLPEKCKKNRFLVQNFSFYPGGYQWSDFEFSGINNLSFQNIRLQILRFKFLKSKKKIQVPEIFFLIKVLSFSLVPPPLLFSMISYNIIFIYDNS